MPMKGDRMGQRTQEKSSAGRCPICRAPTEPEYRPFCSRRCADVDLARWLGGAYAIPGGNVAADEDGDEAEAVRKVAAGQQEQTREDE